MMNRYTVGLALLIACGTADAMTGEMLVDAGELAHDASMMLQDAANALGDAAAALPSDAQAQAGVETLTGACDKAYTRTVMTGSSSNETTTYFAELPVGGTGTINGVDVVRCEREVFGTDPLLPACPSGWTCTGTSRPAVPDCEASTGVELEPQLLRINCGYRQLVGGAAATGYRFKSVRVTVRR